MRGCSIIDYIIVNEIAKERITDFRIGDKVDSDHMSLITKMEMETANRKEEMIEEKKEKKKRNKRKA